MLTQFDIRIVVMKLPSFRIETGARSRRTANEFGVQFIIVVSFKAVLFMDFKLSFLPNFITVIKIVLPKERYLRLVSLTYCVEDINKTYM
jgi:hypothetical protein